MIICTKCGLSNAEDAAFCGSCGSFLEWTGTKVEAGRPASEPAPEPAPPAPEPQARPGLLTQARRALGLEGGEAGPVVAGGEIAAPEMPPETAAAPVPAEATLKPAKTAPKPVVVSKTRIARSAIAPAEEVATAAAPALEPAGPQVAPAATPAEPAPPWVAAQMAPAPPWAQAAGTPPWAAGAQGPGAAQAPVPGPAAEAAQPLPRQQTGPAQAARVVAQPASSLPVAPTAPLPVAPAAEPQEPPARLPGRPVRPEVQAATPAAAQAAGGPQEPDEVRPGAARPRPVVAPVEVPGPAVAGGLVCASCGLSNEAGRRFCRRCGASLAAAPAASAARVPWWRRIFSRGRAPVAAGDRPAEIQRRATAAAGARRGGVGRTIGLAVAAVLVVAIAAVALVPPVRQAVTDTVNSVRMQVAPNYVPVHTAGAATGASLPKHTAQMAFDGFANTWWSAPANASQPTLQASFSPATDIAIVMITSGDYDDFNAQPRPHKVQIDFLDAKGAVVFSKQFDLVDQKTYQSLDVSAKGAVTFKLTVISTYPGSSGNSVSISEVEFWAKS